MNFSEPRLYFVELFLVSMLFTAITTIALYAYYSAALLLTYLLSTVLLIAYSVLYILNRDKHRTGGLLGKALHVTFALFVVSAVAYFTVMPAVYYNFIVSTWNYFANGGFFFVLFLPAYFLGFVGFYFLSLRGRSFKTVGKLFIAGLLILLIFYYFSGYVFQLFRADDETLLAYTSVIAMLHGQNPYTTSIFNSLYTNVSTIGISVTTTNNIVSIIDYPALFFLSFAPFYFAGPPTLLGLFTTDLKLESMVFLFILILVVAYLSYKKKGAAAPSMMMLFFLSIFVRFTASITTYLMFAVLLLAYFKLEKNYSWILLGICASLQEELWPAVIFLLAYSLNNQGFKVGVRNAIGTLAVFLLFNGYFIALNPGAFVSNVITPLNHNLPNPAAPVGYLIAAYVHVLLGVFPTLFVLSLVFLLLVLWRTNRKELIPLFSMIPFMFMNRGLSTYYISFLFVFFFVLAVKQEASKNRLDSIGRFMKEHPASLYAPAVAIVLAAVALVYVSHVQYTSQFSLNAYGSNLSIDNATNTTSYVLHVNYRNLSNSTVYLIAWGLNKNGTSPFGLINTSILEGAHASCGNYTCLVNVNRMELNGSGAYAATVTLNWTNSTPITQVVTMLYNGKYFYITNSTR